MSDYELTYNTMVMYWSTSLQITTAILLLSDRFIDFGNDGPDAIKCRLQIYRLTKAKDGKAAGPGGILKSRGGGPYSVFKLLKRREMPEDLKRGFLSAIDKKDDENCRNYWGQSSI